MATNTDLLLINPANKKQTYGSLGDNLSGIEPPLPMALLAANIREQGAAVNIIDAEAEHLDAARTVDRIAAVKPRVVGVAAMGANPSASSTPKMAAVRPLLRLIKERHLSCRTFVYGIHPSALPERTLREEGCDFVVRGEPFYPVTQLLRTIGSGDNDFNIKGLCRLQDDRFIDTGRADVVRDLDRLPLPAWDLLSMEKYRAHNWHCLDDIDQRSPYGVIYTGLGCPFDCYYCNVHALYEGRPGLRLLNPERVLAQVDRLYREFRVRHMKILDELFVINRERLLDICEGLIARGYDLNIWAYARVDTVSADILKKLKQAGVNWLAFGIEAGADDVRQGVAKGRFDRETVRRAVAMTHEAGIHVLGNFMFGLPDDDMTTMQETLDLARSLDCEYVNFYTTMAYPGSRLYDDARRQGLALPENWQGYAQFSPETLPLPTKYLTPVQVLRFRDEAFDAYYQDTGYLDMIGKKFGPKAVGHIQQMLTHQLQRHILSDNYRK